MCFDINIYYSVFKWSDCGIFTFQDFIEIYIYRYIFKCICMLNDVMNTKISRKKVSKMIGYNLQFTLIYHYYFF